MAAGALLPTAWLSEAEASTPLAQSDRCLVLEIPDWPVVAAGSPAARSGPAAVLAAGRIVTASASARAEGVAVGMRRREAQARCPALELVPADPARDARVFAPIVRRLEQFAAGVQLIRPGLCAIRMRGLARHHGGERPAALALLAAVARLGAPDVRAGVADGPFAARIAARLAAAAELAGEADPAGEAGTALQAEPLLLVPAGGQADFLRALPVAALAEAELADAELIGLLPRLGVRTLGQFAALDAELVRDRFGERGSRLHALAAGSDTARVRPRIPPSEFGREVAFEPPLEVAEQIAFSVRAIAEEFIAGIGAALLVCTELRVTLSDQDGRRSERVWLHPAAFDTAAVVDRVRWQLESAQTLRSPVVAARLEPVAVDRAARHEPGLFGAGRDERLHHALARVQAMLGHEQVVTASLGGGRWLAERQLLVPWGERQAAAPRQRQRPWPWPGSLPAPLPATVFPEPLAVRVLDRRGQTVTADARGQLRAPPATIVVGSRSLGITAWAGPWPIAERGWSARARRGMRIQAVDEEQTAWLLAFEHDLEHDPDREPGRGGWFAEGRYD